MNPQQPIQPTNPLEQPSIGTPGMENNQYQVPVLLKPPVVQRYFVLFMLLLTFWIVIGRSFLGSGGWVSIIMLFTVAPALLVYILIAGVAMMLKSKTVKYVMGRKTQYIFIVAYLSMFLFGLTIVDGGDTRESVNSVLGAITGHQYLQSGSFILNVSEVLSTIFSLSAVTSLVAGFLAIAFAKRQ